MIPLLEKFGVEGGRLEIKKRGLYPDGGGEITLSLPIVRGVQSVDIIETGRIKRIRGVAYSCKINPNLCNRMVDGIRGVFNGFIPDVWVHLDHYKGENSGKSLGYGASLIAETTTGVLISSDSIYQKYEKVLPEDLGTKAAMLLLDEIFFEATIDTCLQGTALLLMAISSSKDHSRIKIG